MRSLILDLPAGMRTDSGFRRGSLLAYYFLTLEYLSGFLARGAKRLLSGLSPNIKVAT